MAIRQNEPRDLEKWMVDIEQRMRSLEARRLDAGPGFEVDHATKTGSAKISDNPENATKIGEDGGIESTNTVTTADDHNPLIIQKYMTAGQNIPTGADTTISWGGTASSGTWTSDATSITIPEDGFYHVNVHWQWANNATGTRVVHVTLNSTAVTTNSTMANQIDPEEGEPAQCLSDYRFFTAGDQLFIRVFQNSGVTLGAGGPYFGDVRGRWTVAKWGDAYPPALTQTNV